MLLAYLDARNGKSVAMLDVVQALADENPAYPEAFEVVSRVAALAGDKSRADQAAQARDELLRNNPDAERQLNLFRSEMDGGKWVFVGRYGRPLEK